MYLDVQGQVVKGQGQGLKTSCDG